MNGVAQMDTYRRLRAENERLREAMAEAKAELLQNFTDDSHLQRAFELLRDALDSGEQEGASDADA